ncbi:MAG: hypothetical protein ACE5HD_01230 [Acidobacteriota bacterium]
MNAPMVPGHPEPASSSIGRIRAAFLLLAALLGTACASGEAPGPARQIADRFCRDYFEQADPAAALAVAAGKAAIQLREETRLLEGVERPDHLLTDTLIVEREEYNAGATIKFRVEVRVFPPAGAARGTPPQVIPFDLILRRAGQEDPGAWRVIDFKRG